MFAQQKARIVIADDHQLFREGLIAALERHPERFEVVGEVSTGYQAVLTCIEKKPDILILDLHMPGDIDGFQVLKTMRRGIVGLSTKIMVLTADPQVANIISSQLGADMCVDKQLSRDEIIAQLDKLFSTVPSSTISRSYYKPPEADPFSFDTFNVKNLSPKELAVLQSAATGKDSAAIAQELVITKGTVNVHLSSIYKKLGVKGLPQAISFAYRNNIIKNH